MYEEITYHSLALPIDLDGSCLGGAEEGEELRPWLQRQAANNRLYSDWPAHSSDAVRAREERLRASECAWLIVEAHGWAHKRRADQNGGTLERDDQNESSSDLPNADARLIDSMERYWQYSTRAMNIVCAVPAADADERWIPAIFEGEIRHPVDLDDETF